MRGLGFLLASLAALTLLAACGSEEAAGPGTTEASRTETSPVAGTTLDGEPVSLADFRGRPVFVNVWSSW